jgi:hypothetical protein
MTSILNSKKAEEGTSYSTTQLIGIVIAVIVVVFLAIPFFTSLYSILMDKPDQGTTEAFENLIMKIEESKNNEGEKMVTYYVDNGLKLVGFNKDQNTARILRFIKLWNPYNEQKPLACGTKACLAVCGEKHGGCTKKLKFYKIIEDVDKIVADKNLEHNSGADNFVVLYGNLWFKEAYKVKNINVNVKNNVLTISS